MVGLWERTFKHPVRRGFKGLAEPHENLQTGNGTGCFDIGKIFVVDVRTLTDLILAQLEFLSPLCQTFSNFSVV